MQAVVYYLFLPLIYGLSILPMRVLYVISDGLYLVVYRLLGYRRKTVMSNLRASFPERGEAEIAAIADGFYRYFCDLAVEVLKGLTISEAELRKRIDIVGYDIYKDYHDRGQSLFIVMGHYGNWEWAGARCALEHLHQVCAIYHPLRNKYFDGLLNRMRNRLGIELFAMKDAIFGIMAKRGELTGTVFIGDQNPSPKNVYWTRFLNQDTPVYKGIETIARRMDYPVLYASMKRTGRGRYVMYNEVLTEKPSALPEGRISALHTQRLERDILEQPETWLWTHRRWKHRRPAAGARAAATGDDAD